jgi:hypothetical protein
LITLLLFSAAEIYSVESAHTDWFHKARLGVFMHFTLKTPEEFALAQQFDVKAVASQLEAMGVGYFIFTIYHQNSDYLVAPNATYDRYTGYKPGERCATRDIPLELYNALHPKGIKLLLYVTSQTPRNDLHVHKVFGLPDKKGDVKMDLAFAKKWAEVLGEWSERYGDKVAGWWFDGCYAWIDFNEEMAQVYAEAVKRGNPHTLVAFNPGVKVPVIRATRAENYTAGELDKPFQALPDSRWLDGAQWHALTYLGAWWKRQDTRYPTEQWVAWVKAVTEKGGVVTLDLGPNLDPKAGPIGTFSEKQMKQFKAIKESFDK